MRDKDYRFIPKEIAVLSVEKELMAHWIVAPPYPYAELPLPSRSQNNFLTRFYHGLEWFEGDVTCKQVYANLRDISRVSGRIFTRGRDKALLLRDVTSRDIINLEEDEDVPPMDKMPETAWRCIRHDLINSAKAENYCALKNAWRIKKWLRNNSFDDELNSKRYKRLNIDDDEDDDDEAVKIDAGN